MPGSSLKELIARDVIRQDLLDLILKVTPTEDQNLLDADAKEFNIFLIQYADGLLVPVLMLPGFASGISVVVKAKDAAPIGGLTEERTEPYPHFAYLLKGIEQMIHTGEPAYPVERTLLTAGMLDRLLTSRSKDGARLQTPELAIDYKAVDYPHSPHSETDRYPRSSKSSPLQRFAPIWHAPFGSISTASCTCGLWTIANARWMRWTLAS